MINFKIVPFKRDSTGAEILARELPGTVADVDYAERRQRGDFVINWGAGYTGRKVDVNQPFAICNAVDKLIAFKLLRAAGVVRPEWTTKKSEANQWLTEGSNVYHRTTMSGERGRGITVFQPSRTPYIEEVRGGWYTRGFNAVREFRVNCAFGKVIEVAEKKRRNGTNPDPLMRSHADWVFCIHNLAPYPNILKEASIRAVEALGLDFGGVDIALDAEGNYCVYEVNTAPWINRESTWTAYTNAFREAAGLCEQLNEL